MAEAAVTFAVERLGDLLISEAKFLRGVSGDIEEIQRELRGMKCFLEESDKRPIADKRVRNWVSEIRELAFKTEDVIEIFAYKKQKTGFKEILRRFVCVVNEGARLHKVGREIKAIRGQLSRLTASLQITKGLEEGQTSNLVDLRNCRIFYSHNIENDFVGMEKEIELLISHLKKEDECCEVVSICGMGGQGKTTVATQIYNHPQVKEHFQVFGWICITQQFDRGKILKSILEQLLPAARRGEVSGMGDEVMINELHKVQQEKKCLVVIDDIWSIDAWRNLRSAFPIGVTKSRSKILLTTRNETVAEIGSVYKLPGLTEEEGWQLISKKVFSLTGEPPVQGVISNMEIIGKKMVARCKGLPLAVSTLGGMLRGKMLREWERINEDIKFYLARGKAGVLDNGEYHTVTHVLGLSYESLPPRLRQCFLSLGNYKEDKEIMVEELYLFWIGEGLISHEDKAQGQTMLEVAECYLDELAHRNLVQVQPWEVEGVSWSKFAICRVHDLIRDLCLSKVEEEKVIRVIGLQGKPDHVSEARDSRIRRLCIHPYDLMDESIVDQTVIPQIRSLLLFKDYIQRDDLAQKIFRLEKFKLLRVFTIQGFRLSKESIRSIGKLVFLKYLSFNGSELEELPSSIGNLINLETLDLRVKDDYIRIPNVLWKFKQLKHLYLPYRCLEDQKKVRFDGMNELECIEGFYNKYCNTYDLIGLSKIKFFTGRVIVDGENPLIIEKIVNFIKTKELCYSRLVIASERGEVSLVSLLECCFIDYMIIEARISALPKDYVHNQFFGRLAYLVLYISEIEEYDPMILLEKLPNLRHLELNNKAYMGREMVCSSTGFPQLQTLKLWKLPNLTKWRVDEGAMPNLSYLHMWGCDNLEMLPDGLRFLIHLKQLELYFMPTAFIDRIQAMDGTEGPDLNKISHVPTVTIL